MMNLNVEAVEFLQNTCTEVILASHSANQNTILPIANQNTISNVSLTDRFYVTGKFISNNISLFYYTQVQDRLEENTPVEIRPISTGNKELLREITAKCIQSKHREAKELATLLSGPHVRALVDTHDEIADEQRLGTESSPKQKPSFDQIDSEIFEYPFNGNMHADAIRMVGLRKNPNEPLGLTVSKTKQSYFIPKTNVIFCRSKLMIQITQWLQGYQEVE